MEGQSPAARPRWIVAGILAVLVGLLSTVSVAASYVRSNLLDTDSYVAMVAPLARDPAVQAQVVESVTTKIVESVRLDDLTDDALELLRARDGRLAQLIRSDPRLADALNAVLSGLGPLLQNQVNEATRRATQRVVESPRFAELWAEANRIAHRTTLAALRDEGQVLRTDEGAVRIDLGAIVAEVKQRLEQSGFGLASRIPTVDREIVLVESAQLARAQTALLVFDAVAPWLPWVTLGLAIVAVAVAPVRRRGLLWVGAAVAVAMIIFAVALAVARGWFVNRVLAAGVDQAAADAVLDAALAPLWSRIWWLLAGAVVVTAGALLAGPAGQRLRASVGALRNRAVVEP